MTMNPDKSTLILAYTNQDVFELNGRARDYSKATGRISATEFRMETERGPRRQGSRHRGLLYPHCRDGREEVRSAGGLRGEETTSRSLQRKEYGQLHMFRAMEYDGTTLRYAPHKSPIEKTISDLGKIKLLPEKER
jgi:hypothetical protein